jgi:tetratricopeptide (TPR) repeat protein
MKATLSFQQKIGLANNPRLKNGVYIYTRPTMKILLILLFLPIAVAAQTSVDQARIFFEARKYDEAKKILVKIPDSDKNYAPAQYYLGRIAMAQNELDDAEDYFEEAIETNDKVAEYHYWLGNALGLSIRDANVMRQGMLAPRIKEEYEKTVALKEDFVDAHWGLVSFYIEAPGFMGGSFDKARAEAKIIAKYNEADGHRALGMIYNKEERYADAEKEYLAAWKSNPAYHASVVTFYVARKEYDKAFNFLESLLKPDPENYQVIYQIGKTSAVSGQRLDRGAECLLKYLAHTPKENEPSHGGANMRLGQIHEKRGNKVEARKSYELALKLDPTLKDAKEGLTRVAK